MSGKDIAVTLDPWTTQRVVDACQHIDSTPEELIESAILLFVMEVEFAFSDEFEPFDRDEVAGINSQLRGEVLS